MNDIDKLKEDAVLVKIKESEEFLQKLHEKRNYKIVSSYPTINTIDCELERGTKCFKYSTGEILPVGPPVKYQNESYGLQKSFKLVSDDFKINVTDGVSSVSINLAEGFKSSGIIREIQSESFWRKSIFRAIFPLSDNSKKPFEVINSLPFKTESYFRVAGFIPLEINEIKFNFYNTKINETDSLVIESLNAIAPMDFENTVLAVLYSFAMLSGSLVRSEVTIIQYLDNSFETATGFKFKKIEDSINGMSAIEPKLFAHLSKENIKTPHISSNLFSTIVTKSLNDLRLFRSIRIITESFNYPLEIKASTYSVALETLKNIIIEQNEKTINPFKSKKTASDTIKALKEVINKVKQSEFNNKSSVLKKLEQINQVGNKDSFLLSFQLLDIPLNEDDKRCINMRNDFLHGRIPFENEEDSEDYKLQHIVYKLHLLTTSLIMKYCGYNGLMLNNIKLADLIHFRKNINEPLFRKI